jgi:hypothetical protein
LSSRGARGEVSGEGFNGHVRGGSTSGGSIGLSGTSRDNRCRGRRGGRRDSGRCTGGSSAGALGFGHIELLGLGEDASVLGVSGEQVDLETGTIGVLVDCT